MFKPGVEKRLSKQIKSGKALDWAVIDPDFLTVSRNFIEKSFITAINANNLQALKGLLNVHPDIDGYFKGETVRDSLLQIAWNSQKCSTDIFIYSLVDMYGDQMKPEVLGEMACHFAACGDVGGLKKIIETGGNVSTYTSQTKDFRYTPLTWAARQGQLGCVEALVEAGVDIDFDRQHHGLTALSLAQNKNRSHIIHFFHGVYEESRQKRQASEERQKQTGYHFVDADTVTEVLSPCPVNGALSRLFNFKSKTVMMAGDRGYCQPMSFEDYKKTAVDGQEDILKAYHWLKDQDEGAPTYPFKKAVAFPQK